jgi:hypothetical protein
LKGRKGERNSIEDKGRGMKVGRRGNIMEGAEKGEYEQCYYYSLAGAYAMCACRSFSRSGKSSSAAFTGLSQYGPLGVRL